MPKTDRIVIHAGLPKTATSSLQLWSDTNRHFLLSQGVDYPPPSGGSGMLKHQGLVNGLMRSARTELWELLTRNNGATMFLSTEGLTNHLFDFPEDALTDFRKSYAGYEVTFFITFREKNSWVNSYYKQAVINPPNSKYLYGTTLTLEAFSKEERVRRLVDRKQVVDRVKAAFCPDTIVTGEFENGWFEKLGDVIGIDRSILPTFDLKANVSPSALEIETIRQFNEFATNREIRVAFLGLLQSAIASKHTILTHSPLPHLTQKAELARILSLMQPSDVSQSEIFDVMSRQLHQ